MTRHLKELNTNCSDLESEGDPLVGAPAEVEDGEIEWRVHRAQAVELGEDPSA
jgi:hypothetical protein